MHVSAQTEQQLVCEWLLTSAVIYAIECAWPSCMAPWTSTITLWLIHASRCLPRSWEPSSAGVPVVDCNQPLKDQRPQGQC